LDSFDLGQFSIIPKKEKKNKKKKKKTKLFLYLHSELILTSRKKLVELSSSPTR
jgi:hypothetical protein